MQTTRISIWLIILILQVSHSRAQSDYQFDHITTKDGLSQNSVMAIMQDKFGFMWFGTRDGLNMYNGVNISIYNHDSSNPNSLSNSHITHLAEDSQGNLWISTLDGLTKFERETESFHRYYIPELQAESAILCTFEDSRNNLWVGARAGLFLFDRKENKLKPADFSPSSSLQPDRLITCIFEDSTGDIWFGTMSDGVFIYSSESDEMIRLDMETSPAMNHDRVETIAEDHDGNIWLGTYGGGVNIWERNSNSFRFLIKNDTGSGLNNNLVRSILNDHNGHMWIGTFNGLNVFDPVTDEMQLYTADGSTSHSMNNGSIRALYQDRQGTIWIGTYFGGVNIFDPVSQRFKQYIYSSDSNNSLSYNVVSSIVEDEHNNLWIGTERGGLNLYDRKLNHFEVFMPDYDAIDELPLFTIKSLFLDGDKIWIGTHRRGMYLFDIRKSLFSRIFDSTRTGPDLSNAIINTIFKDRNGYLWLCTESYGGLFKFDPRTMNIVPFDLQVIVHEKIQNSEVRSIFQDDFGNFWVATKRRGIILFNEETGYVDGFSSDDHNPLSLQSNQVYHITQDSDKNIWVSTYGAGIGKFDRISKGFDFSYSALGLLHDKVNGILEDANGNLWISTNRGVSWFDKSTNSFRNFDYQGELSLSELTEGAFHLGKYSGNMYFGGIDGLVELNPNRFIINEYVPQVAITGFKLFNVDVKTGDHTGILKKSLLYTNEIKLRYNQSIFSIDFFALNYTYSGNNEYAYMLEGLESSWNHVKNQTFATYTLLNPGEYIFKVKASNNDGLWNDSPTTLKITVLPPPWKEWYAYLGYALIISLILYFVRYYGLRSEQMKNNLLIQKIQQEKMREINEAKIDFFTNISHEFRAHLTLIIGPLKELLSTHRKQDEAKKKLTLVMQNAQLLNRLVDQLLVFRKLESGKTFLKVHQSDWVSLARKVSLYFSEYAKSRNISLSFKSLQREIIGFMDDGLIEKVLFNIISNAFKYTQKHGKIKIRVSKEIVTRTSRPLCSKFTRTIMIGNALAAGEEAVMISVEDTGIGITHDELDKIFDKFYLTANNMSAGTGIGLFIVKNIIELHHGCIEVCSEKNTGTAFTLIIPLNESHYLADEKKRTGGYELTEPYTGPFPSTESVIAPGHTPEDAPLLLLVEDNDELAKYLVSILHHDYKIRVSPSAKEAQTIIKNERPDIIVCDILIKGSNGIKLCESVKKNKNLQDIPVIMLTADLSEENRIQSFMAGADAYITKPFAPELLKIRMKNLLLLRQPPLPDNARVTERRIIGNDEKLVIKINDIVRKMISDPKLNVETLGREVGMSRMQLYRRIKEITGFTAVEYIRDIRLTEAANLLRQDKLSIKEIAGLTGFADIDYFRNQFKRKFGVTPSMFVDNERKKNITRG
jgi:ligand-binding sensor domain-containing protein/signal transduction histidine kinase/DNA-binding response OmpR family regulator